MYAPKKYQMDQTIAADFIRRYPFATLVGVVENLPSINHIPLNIEDSALWGHVAYANPLWKELAGTQVSAVFHGPHAFIDHRWYENPSMEVPTWNYAVVHVSGTLTAIHEPGELLKALDRLQSAMNEVPTWAKNLPPDLASPGVLEKSIVGLKIDIQDIQVKFKLSQNKNSENQKRVIEALTASPRHEDNEVARLMRQVLT
ncbi:MAG: FMN-binding negative transcriptional regulator [Bacteriovoracia bacterium]